MIAKFLNETAIVKKSSDELNRVLDALIDVDEVIPPFDMYLSDGKPGNWFEWKRSGKTEFVCYSRSEDDGNGNRKDFVCILGRYDVFTVKPFGDYLSPEKDSDMVKKRAAYVRDIVKKASKLQGFPAVDNLVSDEYLKCKGKFKRGK